MRQTADPGIRPDVGAERHPLIRGLNGYVHRLIGHWARRLVREAGLPASEIHDVEQDLWLDLLTRWNRFDATRATAKTFASRIVEHRAVKIRCQLKNSARRRHSRLPVDHGDAWRGDGASANAGAGDFAVPATCVTRRDGHSLIEDVASVLSQLPSELRDLCERLKCDGIAEVARQTGTSRSALYRQIKIVREHFEAAEVHRYL